MSNFSWNRQSHTDRERLAEQLINQLTKQRENAQMASEVAKITSLVFQAHQTPDVQKKATIAKPYHKYDNTKLQHQLPTQSL